MHDALKRADAVVCVLTHAYLKSANCTDEWTNTEKIIPVKFDDCKPPGLLTSRVYIDLCGLDKDSARDRLLAQLRGTARPIDEPDAPFAPVAHNIEEEPEYHIFGAKHNLTRNKNFIGREDILTEISKGLRASSVVSILGAGGFGKTQTVVEYAFRHASEYDLMWCFNAESAMKLQEDYREFALQNLGLTEMRKDEFAKIDFETVHRTVNEWFRVNTSCLLIYDNAEGCPDLHKYLPYGQSRNHLCYCERCQNAAILCVLQVL